MVKAIPESTGSIKRKTNHLSKKKRAWTVGEDQLLTELVKEFGPSRCSFISVKIDGRVGKQCRERWHNHLNPKINKSDWTHKEEFLLFLSHKLFGSSWAEISKSFSGRTDNSIKNHWNSAMKRRKERFNDLFNEAVAMSRKSPLRFSRKFDSREKKLIKALSANCKKDRHFQPVEQFNCQHSKCQKLIDVVDCDGQVKVDYFCDEQFVSELIGCTMKNFVSYPSMAKLFNFIEENEESILSTGIGSKQQLSDGSTVNSNCDGLSGFHSEDSSIKQADGLTHSDYVNQSKQPSLLVPTFFIKQQTISCGTYNNDESSLLVFQEQLAQEEKRMSGLTNRCRLLNHRMELDHSRSSPWTLI